jgi:hypothetical protein
MGKLLPDGCRDEAMVFAVDSGQMFIDFGCIVEGKTGPPFH